MGENEEAGIFPASSRSGVLFRAIIPVMLEKLLTGMPELCDKCSLIIHWLIFYN